MIGTDNVPEACMSAVIISIAGRVKDTSLATSVPEEYTAFYRAYCKKHGLLSSGGTDCHEDPPHAYLKLSEGRDMAWHAGESVWLDEILERVRLWNV